MDILVCMYPLLLTYNYYDACGDNGGNSEYRDIRVNCIDNLHFLTTWWSTFGALTLMEKYGGLDNVPFYTFAKGGILLSMYSNSYREWIRNHMLEGVKEIAKKTQNITKTIIDEHFPSLNKYINTPNIPNTVNAKDKKDEPPNYGWFASSVNWFTQK